MMKLVINKPIILSILLAASITLISLAGTEKKDNSAEYLDKLDSVVSEMDSLHLRAEACLKLNASYAELNLEPKANLLTLAGMYWHELENIYTGEYRFLLKNVVIDTNDKSAKSRFDEIVQRAADACNVWLYRDITFAYLKTNEGKAKSKEILNKLINYYYFRDVPPVEFLALAELLMDTHPDEARSVISSIPDPYLRAAGYAKIKDRGEALREALSITQPAGQVNALIMILNAGHVEDALNRLMQIVRTKNFIDRNIYSAEKIVRAVSYYSKQNATEIIDLVPEDYPDIKSGCILDLKEINPDPSWDGSWKGYKLEILIDKIDSRIVRQSLLSRFMALLARSPDYRIDKLHVYSNGEKYGVKPSFFSDKAYMDVLSNYAKTDPGRCFQLAGQYISDPSMVFKVQLAALNMLAESDRERAAKLAEIMEGELASIPDKTLLADLLRCQVKFQPDHAADKIAELENPILRCRLYGECGALLYKDNVHLSEVLFQKAWSTYRSLPETGLDEKIKILVKLAGSRLESDPTASKAILDSATDLVGENK